jgi:hypothetical protein
MKYPLNGAWAKHEQAEKHYQRYIALFHAYAERTPFTTIPEDDTPDLQDASDSLGPGDVWHELSCAAGDTIHNLRSALDHVAYAVASTRSLSAEQLKRVYFVIRPTEAAFNKVISKRDAVEPHIGPDWISFLRNLQPFATPPNEGLARINDLDNMDKHRLLLGLMPTVDVTNHHADGQVRRSIVPLSDGRVRLRSDESGYMVSSHYLTLPNAPTGSVSLSAQTELLSLYALVAAVIRRANAAFFSRP